MAAVARAMALADPHTPLTLYTDCMAILNAISLWTAHTLVVWVAAHIGYPGNELANMAANAGTSEENSSWDLDTCPIALHSISTSTFPLLHEANWTPTVDRHVRGHVG
eukprot:3941473-Rhodomonas_salina.3